MRILVVEDDEQVASTLTEALVGLRYAVDVAHDGQDGWDLAESFSYDLILLDMMLPRLDGISLCRKLRAKNSRVPILMLTARDTSPDKVMGLDAGADDYVVKPFNLSELSARIRALLRRGEGPVTPTLTWGGLELNPTTCEVTYEGRPLHLSPKEYALLELFLRNARRVFSRTAILDHVWSYEDSPGEDTVKAHIKGLRQKLKTVGAAELIETVYGLGYRLKPLDVEKSEPTSVPGPSQAEKEAETRKEQTRATVARAWEKARDGVMRRVVVLEEAIASLQQGIWEEATRQQAEQEAHKLAGSVG
ncbi:MAG: response regulator transcription factor, partial [Leptolyngbyaceae cyanobacterium bins.59]|nr:response regulator transcription factor [Leptolyngbyaceae cyanobacterium bins.59]